MDKFSHAAKKLLVLTLSASMMLPNSYSINAAEAGRYASVTSLSDLKITESSGWLESSYVEWSPVSGAQGYNVYYKAANQGDASYKQLDSMLIRSYGTYMRADALGLAAGSYVMKVVPIVNGAESKETAQTSSLTVKANAREGFAFSKNSTMGTGSGGYNDDGTVPANAQILYLTKDNVNTVTLDVITNSKGSTTTCTGLTDIMAKRQKGYDKTPLIIRLIGTIKNTDISGLNSAGYLQVKGCYNTTIEGVGEDAVVYGWGMLIRAARNVEIRNLGVMMFPDDGISLDTDNENIWIHNNDIFYGKPGSDSDQVKGDGSTDVKAYSTNVTISYNHYYDSGKCSLCGMSDTKNFYVTYHHNWFDHSDSRHPRIRVGTIHIYNNYFDGNAKYGVGVTKGSSAFVEANVFRNCKYPMLSSMQGTDVYGDNQGTFSGEPGGMIKAYNNQISGAKRLVYAQENAVDFDAYEASSRDEKVSSSYKTVSGGTTYNNFDTDSSVMYSYNPTDTSNVESNVTTYAGRVNGGDFKWDFDDSVDDESYTVNAALKQKLIDYKSSLVSVGGNSVSTPTTNVPATTTTVPAASVKPSTSTAPAVTASTAPSVAPTESVNVGSLTSTGMYTNLYNKDDSYFANAIYAAPNGNSNGNGTASSPYDLATAVAKLASSESGSILLKAGTYKFSDVITIGTDNNGKANAYKVMKACKGAEVVLDFSGESYNTSDTSVNARGIQMNGNYWYFQGLTIKGAADNGMMLSGSHNIIEQCVFDSNRDTGLQISRRASSVTDYNEWPSYNTIINCTSKNNCDPATYENADGFAAKLTCGDGNVFDGCMSYNNSDDGWDLFAKTATGPIGVVTIRNCIAMRNGMTEDGTTQSSCDGNGFKLGGSGVGTPHIVTNCIAIENLHHGFTDNNNPSALQITNCTAFDNNKGGGKNNFSLYRCKDAYAANCVSYTTNNASDKYVNLSGEYLVLTNSSKWYKVTDKQVMDTGSSASRGEVISTGIKASDFINANVAAVGTDFNALWRNADGTINTNGVGMISSSSAYADFSTDGGVIGARLSSTGSKTEVTVEGGQTSITPGTQPSTVPSVQPSTAPSVSPSPSTAPAETAVQAHNFTTDGKTSSFFNITGSLSTSKGSVSYNGLTLTQCLKMESSTNVAFTAKKEASLTLVFNTGATGSINIDGTAYAASNGVVTVDLAAGSHTITKKDVMNLYYIGLAYK